MRLLLDSHVFVWWSNGDKRLTKSARSFISDSSSVVHVSTASIWELSIKFALGRLDLKVDNLSLEVSASGFEELPVSGAHAWHAGQLPRHHKDPFDRMLIAQAELEQLMLVTSDDALAAYGVPILPAV